MSKVKPNGQVVLHVASMSQGAVSYDHPIFLPVKRKKKIKHKVSIHDPNKKKVQYKGEIDIGK